jgi:hypothetical protein
MRQRWVRERGSTHDEPSHRNGSGQEPLGTAYLHHLIVPIAGPSPEYLASFLLFRQPRFGKKTRIGLFNVGTEHACVDEAHLAAVQSGKAKVDDLLTRRWP